MPNPASGRAAWTYMLNHFPPPSAPREPAGPAPKRRPNSIRRTSTIDISWPEGFGKPARMDGAARDLATLPGGEAIVTALAHTRMVLSPSREILEISVDPQREAAQNLRGARGGNHSRKLLGRYLADDAAAATPLYLLLDDFAGASLVAPWAWSLRADDWPSHFRAITVVGGIGRKGVVEGVCAGFRPGSTALDQGGAPRHDLQNSCAVPELINPQDPLGWHKLAQQDGVAFRRARRIDVSRDNALVRIDVGFQDSATAPIGGRVAVHEYSVSATADLSARVLLSLTPRAHILPFGECPSALDNAHLLLGKRLECMRDEVLAALPGALGCTHLNDVFRSLADAPGLLDALLSLSQKPEHRDQRH